MKKAQTDYPVHNLIAERWSPYAFSEKLVPREDLLAVFEAARWAASSYNEQPWSFIVASRDDEPEFDRVLSCLVEANQQWAKAASILALAVARTRFSRNGKPNRHAFHDLGLAVGNLSLEATSRGLAVHQMAGIDPEKARTLFDVPEDSEVATGIAIGYSIAANDLSEPLRQRDTAERSRRPLEEILFSGRWGTPHPALDQS